MSIYRQRYDAYCVSCVLVHRQPYSYTDWLCMSDELYKVYGMLAFRSSSKLLPLKVMKSAAGYYIGTADEDGLPNTRESVGYWRSQFMADLALAEGDWEQKSSL